MRDHSTLIKRIGRNNRNQIVSLRTRISPDCDLNVIQLFDIASSRRVEQVIKTKERWLVDRPQVTKRKTFFRGNVQRWPLWPCEVLAAWRTTRKNGRGSRVRKVPANRRARSHIICPFELSSFSENFAASVLSRQLFQNFRQRPSFVQELFAWSWLPSAPEYEESDGKGQVQGHKSVSNKPNVKLRRTVVKGRELEE